MNPTIPVHFEVLPNGLTLLLRETHLSPVVDLEIWAQVGSADERPGEYGLAHFHEHMLFKGTERRGVGDVASEIEGAGGRINAYTSFDTTVYYATLPSDAIDTGVDVLVDAVRHSTFDPTEIDREIEVVLEEIRRSNDSPLHVLSDAVFHEAYQVHPYRSPILGPPESVASFNRDSVRAFFERWYAPDNLVVVAAGDFDRHALAERLREAFADATASGVSRARPAEPKQRELRDVIVRGPFERARLDLSWRAPAFRDPAATHLDLLSFILGECDSSRLVQRVKERDGVVDRIDSGSYTPLDPGLFSVSAELPVEQGAPAITAIVREVERLRRQPVGDDELERAKANFLASEHFERESVSGQARKLGSFHVLGGDWRSEELYFETIRSATAADLQRAAEAYLQPEQLTAGILLPENEAKGFDSAAVEEAARKGIASISRQFTVPARSAFDGEVQSYTLPNGAKINVVARREVPVVAARAAFLGGLLSEDEDRAGITSFLAGTLLRGTRARSAADFARSVEGLAAEIDTFSGRNSLGATLEATSDKLEPALDLFAETLLEPGFDSDEIERERRETLAGIERREDRLAQLAFLLFTKTLFPHHPYRLPMVGERASVERFDEALLEEHHQRWIRAENAVIGIAGDVDPDKVAEAFANRLSELPSGDFTAPANPIDEAPAGIREVELIKEREQAHLVIGFPGLRVTDPDRHALEVLAQVLAGQGGRLFLELRDRKSLAYSVNAMNVEGVDPGFFALYIATAPEKVDEARRGILEELEKLVQEAPSEAELSSTKRNLIGNFAIDQQRSSSHAAHLSLDALYGLGTDADRRYRAEVTAVTREDVLRVSQHVLRLDAYTQALVRP